jgi:DNA polymerase III subunit alpha
VLDKAAAAIPRNLRVVLDSRILESGKGAMANVRAVMKPSGTRGGEIRLVLPLEGRGRELEFVLPGRYEVSPQDTNRLSAMAGVVEVAEV